MWNQSIWVMCGGALGAWLRFALQQKIALSMGQIATSTLLINVIGGFLIGLLSAWVMGLPNQQQLMYKALLISGFCGGFTTFSAFSLEMWQLLQVGKPMQAVLLALLHVGLSLVAVILGWYALRASWH